MNKSLNQGEKEKVWRTRIARAAEFPGSIRTFCQNEGVSVNGFQYWKQKIARENQTPALIPSPFVRVQVGDAVVESRQVSGLPDPKWIAEVILHLYRGSR